ncbi:MAG TPA: hypothetical protein VI365_29650 [Trebonia sp.]
MSPHSRRSQPPSGSSPGGVPNALFRELLRAARELLAVRSPLDAELMVSELLGTWWDQRHQTPDVERIIGEGLVEFAACQPSPAALALLSGVACLGTPRQAVAAERAAIAMIDSGVKAPAWADHLGAVASAECYVNPDKWGDQDEIICVFSYAGEEPHALVSVIDHNADGMIRDGWVTSKVDKLLDHCHLKAGIEAAGGAHPEDVFRQIEPSQARRALEHALAATNTATDPPVSDTFASRHALIRSRIRALPPAAGRALRPKRPWSRDRRALLAADFLSSDEAEDLSDRQAASQCADHIIDFGCDQDAGRPLRMSPAKVRKFLLEWVPRRVMLSSADREAIPLVLAAWVRFGGRQRGWHQSDISEVLEVVFDSMSTFARLYHDPADFGLDDNLVRRLLPDSDLEALPRRAFIFPILEGRHGGVDLSKLDPANPADRRLLLAADHDTRTGSPSAAGVGRHIERHLAIADRLWRGDPQQLWTAAQRLLDTGEDRHLVLHALMDVLDAAGDDQDVLASLLRDLTSGLDGLDNFPGG